MPYYIYKIIPGETATARTLEYTGEHESYREAKNEVKTLRTAQPKDADLVYVALELERQRIREIETLAAPGAVAVELLAGRIVLLTDVLKSLGPDDVYSSAIVAYGSREEPVIAQRAERWFVSPGPVRASAGMLLFEDDGGVELTLLDASSNPMHTRRLMDATEARLRVSGEADA